MISKEEYRQFVNEITSKDRHNKNLKHMKKGYGSSASLFFVLGFMFCVIGFIYFTPVFGAAQQFDGVVFTVVFCVIGIILFFLGGERLANYKKSNNQYKDKYISEVLKKLMEGYEYTFDKYGQVEERVFINSGFVEKYDNYVGYDKLTVNIPNDDNSKSETYMTLCDLDVTKTVEDDEGNKKNITVYKGVFGYVEFPFKFKCVLCLNDKYGKANVNLEKVMLEDINFHKKFGVYSDDQIEARYILTPKMMEKLMFLESKVKNIKMILVDNKMYFGFVGSDLFELGDYRDEMSTIFEDIYDDVSAILVLVNEIKDNNKVFKI